MWSMKHTARKNNQTTKNKTANSTKRLRQPQSKHWGNAANEALPQCISQIEPLGSYTLGAAFLWQQLGITLALQYPMMTNSVEYWTYPSLPALFLLAETCSPKEKEEKKKVWRSKNWLKTHGIQAQWNFFCFSSPDICHIHTCSLRLLTLLIPVVGTWVTFEHHILRKYV